MAHNIQHDEAIILHRYPYSETSLILQVFTRQQGRVSLLAKGVKRPHSLLAAVLHPFQHCLIEYSGKNELKTLRQAEWATGMQWVAPKHFASLLYLHELLLMHCPIGESAPALYHAYLGVLTHLSQTSAPISEHFALRIQQSMRCFEYALIEFLGLGFGAQLPPESSLAQHQHLTYLPLRGWQWCNMPQDAGLYLTRDLFECIVQKKIFTCNHADLNIIKHVFHSILNQAHEHAQPYAYQGLQTRQMVYQMQGIRKNRVI